jgi:hypothetical protein
MKSVWHLLFLLLFIVRHASAQQNNTGRQLQQLINQKDVFTARELLAQKEASALQPYELLLYRHKLMLRLTNPPNQTTP